MLKVTKDDALLYHSRGRHGKIEVIPTKPYDNQHDLSMAYTPGVAYPCLEIEKRDPRMSTIILQRGTWLQSYQTAQQYSAWVI